MKLEKELLYKITYMHCNKGGRLRSRTVHFTDILDRNAFMKAFHAGEVEGADQTDPPSEGMILA